MRRALVLALLLCLPLAGCPKGAPPEVVVDAPQAMTLEVLNRWVEEVCGLIEEESGGTFTHTPHVRLATTTELRQVVIDEAVAMDRIAFPDVPERVHRAKYQGMNVAGILGKYGIFTDVMYVDPDAVFSMAQEEHWDSEGTVKLAKVLLAHELVHALQAQYADSDDQWEKLRDADMMEAYRSVTEGQASWVERRVAKRLDAGPQEELMIAMQGWSFEEGAESAASFPLWSAYGRGDVWMQSLFEQGGHALQWQVVREPPTRSAMIWGTEPYSAAYRPPPEGWAEQFAGLERGLGHGTWLAAEARMGETALRQLHFAYQEQMLPHIHAIEEGWSREANLPDRTVVFERFRFADADAAQGFVEAIAAGGGTEEEADHRAVERLEGLGEQAVKITAAPGLNTGGGSLAHNEHRAWYIRLDREVIALHCMGFRPGLRTEAVLTGMLERMEAP